MLRQKSPSSRNPFKPDYIVDSVFNIDFKELHKTGIRACLIDLDGTVVARGGYDVSDQIKEAIKGAPMKFYIATNRPKSRDLKELRADLNANGVVHPKGLFGKPFKRYYETARRDLSLKDHEVAMIGDRFLQDIYGANRAGLRTILVSNKIGPAHGWADHLLSKTERALATRFSKKYQSIK